MDIKHNLEVAKPGFMFFIKNMTPDLARFIQYAGVEIEPRGIFFKFKSSANSLEFSVYAGVDMPDAQFKLQAKSNEIYDFFKHLKYQHLMNL